MSQTSQSKDMSRQRQHLQHLSLQTFCVASKSPCATVFAEGTEGGDFDFHFFETPSQIQLSLDLTT